MNNDSNFLAIKQALDLLRTNIGDSAFGYRMQAFFAHVLLELGASIIEINQQGHPDIKSNFNGKTFLFQIKTITHSGAGLLVEINPADIDGICPHGLNESGYFAILDCALPISWILVEYEQIRRHKSLSVPVETIRVAANVNFSNECTALFIELVTRHLEKLQLLTYAILRSRALRGEHP